MSRQQGASELEVHPLTGGPPNHLEWGFGVGTHVRRASVLIPFPLTVSCQQSCRSSPLCLSERKGFGLWQHTETLYEMVVGGHSAPMAQS